MPPADRDPRLPEGRPAHPPPRRGRRPGAGTTAVVVVAVLVAGSAGVLGARWLLDELRDEACEFRAADRTETFTPEQSANAATIASISVARGLAPRAASIALATAIQESELRNLSYGDADSVGLFQQRPSQGWGSQEQVQDPVYAANAFYDALEAVPGWQDMEVTVIAQEVQRSAYPDAYADHEWEGRVLASTLTGETPAAMGCDLDPAEDRGVPQAVLEKAQRQFGGTGEVTDQGVLFTAGTEGQAWAMATWAVAHAQAESVTTVEIGSLLWSRSDEPLTWRESGDGDLPATSVLVTLAR